MNYGTRKIIFKQHARRLKLLILISVNVFKRVLFFIFFPNVKDFNEIILIKSIKIFAIK